MLKKLLTFIQEFNKQTIDFNKLQSFKIKFKSDIKYRNKVMEQIAIFNDRFVNITISKISANLFAACIDEQISYKEFVNLNISLDQIHPSSFDFLEMSQIQFEINPNNNGENRNWEAEALLLSSGLASETSQYSHGLRITKEGKNLFKIGIKPLLKSS